jgi:nicotinamidase-related amidase
VFGATCSEIQHELENFEDQTLISDVSKTQFSMMTTEVKELLNDKLTGRNKIILCGIEAHVCLLQTALDLLEENREVYVVCDAASSQKPHDRAVAMRRLQEAGATLTTSESVLFDLVRDSQHPTFKELSAILKDHNNHDNEFATSLDV